VRFGAIINRMRWERRWTLQDLARFTGMHATHLGILERGGNMPSLATILKLAEVFGVTASSLVREVEEQRSTQQ
jgi:transcriptional regulator with XRE-family HTH domain